MKTLLIFMYLLSAAASIAAEPSVAPKPFDHTVARRLHDTTVPQLDLKDATLAGALEAIRPVSGLTAQFLEPSLATRKFDLRLVKYSALDALAAIAQKAQVTGRIEGDTIIIGRLDAVVEVPGKVLGAEERAARMRLRREIVPIIDFENTTLGESLDVIALRRSEIESREPRIANNIVVRDHELSGAMVHGLFVNVTVWDFMGFMARQIGATLDISGNVIEFRRK